MLSALQRHAHAPLSLLVPLNGFLEKIEIADHDAKHIVEIVSDASGQTADGFQLAGMEQVLLHLLAFGDIEPHSEGLMGRAIVVARENHLIEEMPLDTVGAAPAIFEIDAPLLPKVPELRKHAVAVLGIDPGSPEIRTLQKGVRCETCDPL